jgi:hypothetical protein
MSHPPTRRLALAIHCCSWALALIAAAHAQAGADTRPTNPRIAAIHIVSSVNEPDALADDTPKRVRLDVGVTLHAVVEVEHGMKRIYYSDASTIRLRGRTHQARPMAEAPPAALAWYKVEPTTENMSNTATGSFRYERIQYREVMVRSWLLRASVEADVRPTLTGDHGRGAGTMRYKLSAVTAQGVLTTPGAEARRGRGSGGLSDRVHRVSLRRDDTFLGIMTELYGQPYIWASAGGTARTHQSERLEGADCADLMVYGARRKGYDIPYTWTGGLHPYTRTLARGTPGEDGVYVDAQGKPLAFPRAGDMLLFPRHVGALVEDRGVPGVLDTADIMMHTLFASPREQPIAETGYGNAPIEIVRWKKTLDR